MLSKYTELLQLKNIFRIFWNCFETFYKFINFISFFKTKIRVCVKSGWFLKMMDADNNKLTGLLLIAEGSLLLSQDHIKERRKQRKWARLWIRKRDSKGAYYSVINDPSLTDKEDFRKYPRMNTLAAVPILLLCLNRN